jgi:hypothetical protein
LSNYDRRRRSTGGSPGSPRRTDGPRTPPTLKFNPLAVGFGVFTAIAIPFAVVGYTRAAGVNGTIILVGIAIGIVAGVIAATWVAQRDGRVWKGPQL